MKALPFLIRLIDPVLVTQVGGGDPNSGVGYDFIPGSTFRGAFIALYLNGKRGSLEDETFRRLFFDGGVRFLNGYPWAGGGQRTLPTPLSWRIEKDYPQPVYDLAVEDPDPDKEWKLPVAPFCLTWIGDEGEEKVEFYRPEGQVNIHIARDDRQRPVAGNSAVFRYDALAAGQTFAAAILVDDEEKNLAMVETLLASPLLSLGRSHRAGYGRARLERLDPADWSEYQPVGSASGRVIITLLSDALIRDPETGAYVANLKPVLGRLHEQAFCRTRVVGGFNRTWNLPVPQATAIAAGSVFVYPHDDEVIMRLKTVAEEGIGERRVDGLGRIAIDWHGLAHFYAAPIYHESPQPVLLQGENQALARRMAERMLRAELDQALTQAINGFDLQRRGLQNAQISRLRSAVRRAPGQETLGTLAKHLGNLRRPAAEQLQRARVGGEPLKDWLESLAARPQLVWERLGGEASIRRPAVGGVRAELNDKLAVEYAARLVDGLLRKTLREVQQ